MHTIAAAFAIAATKARLEKESDEALSEMLLFMRDQEAKNDLPLQYRAIVHLMISCILDEIGNRIIRSAQLDDLTIIQAA